YTGLHYVPQIFLTPKPRRSPHHCKAFLEYPKSSFNIFPHCLLYRCEMDFLVALWRLKSFHKRRPCWIYPISKIVTHCVLVSIDHVFHLRRRPRSQTLEEWRTAQNVDIV
ncbi:hypothetical protein PVAP13_5KG140514, partial [Panicum virgatum]